jgi:diguanylate cyclase
MITIGESSLLLWLMAAVVALLSAYLFIGWVRRVQGVQGWREWAGPVLLAGTVLGLGFTSAMVLAMSAEALPFPLGYRWIAVPALFLLPPLACVPAAWWLSRRQNWIALLACGLMLAAVALAVQVGWIMAAGLRPGLRWNPTLVGAAAAMGVVGFVAASWLAYSDSSGDGARKTLWRVGGAVLMAITLVASQEVVVSAVGLLAQVGSVYQREAPATWLCLLAGALVPIVMAVLALDLMLRNSAARKQRSRSGSGGSGSPYTRFADESRFVGSEGSSTLVTPRRRKRRRKYRVL